ncbi:hypothetical protein A3I50_00570 [Candidatus Roizmanbacteria bacterium RIFCSPLOWO2_02_FULL_37_9]|nr:MAG: hypothetical protein A3I50_00570 [Candidatus Roizmanbacteria bacterium RIFCSPLOWO2_02_FULL_37_9]
MYDFICIGNISIDLYFKGESLTYKDNRFQLAIGGKYFADEFYEDIGGGGCNVAAGLTKHGYKVAVFAKIGNNPFRELILKKLKDKNISSQLCQYQNNYFKISTILLSTNGERTIVNYETPNKLWQGFELNEDIKKAKNVYLGPLPHVDIKEKNKIVNHFKGDKVLTIVNLASTDCQRQKVELNVIFDSLDILIVNSHEFADLVKKDYQLLNFNNNLLELLPEIQSKILIITDAEKGSHGYIKKQVFFQPALMPEKILDTTGAGDGYTAGFIAEYFKTKNIKKAMNNGARYAAKILTKIGAN